MGLVQPRYLVGPRYSRLGDEGLNRLYNTKISFLSKRFLFKYKTHYMDEPMIAGTIPLERPTVCGCRHTSSLSVEN